LDELKDENSRLLLEIHDLKEQLLVEKAESSRHQQAASVLARERTWLVSKMVALDKLINNLETSLIAEQTRADTLETQLNQARQLSHLYFCNAVKVTTCCSVALIHCRTCGQLYGIRKQQKLF
jgi:predicted RNase H-like nuclease (RuvC/YqgF family)